MADESPELIEQRMQDTRQSLAEKLSALETSARQTFADVAGAVQENVQAVRSGFQEASGSVQGALGGVRSLLGGGESGGVVGDASDSIKHGIQSVATAATDELRDAVDFGPRIRENPLQYVGGAVAAGFVVGLVFGGGRSGGGGGGIQAAYGAPAGRPGIFDELLKMLGEEVRKVGETALTQLTQSVNQSVKAGVPKLVDQTISRVVDAASGAGHQPAGQASGQPAGQASGQPAANDVSGTGYNRRM